MIAAKNDDLASMQIILEANADIALRDKVS